MFRLQSISKYRDQILQSVWFVPSTLVLGSWILAALLLIIDLNYQEQLTSIFPWILNGTADAARGLLSTIAASAITVVSISFSITIVALQQATVQYSPRLLRTFISDRTNQVVLGSYIATFVYALLILRTIRSESFDLSEEFIPALSVNMAVLLILICLGLLIVFIQQLTNTLQVSTIVSQIHKDIISHLDKSLQSQLKCYTEAKDMNNDYSDMTAIRSPSSGFIQQIHLESISKDQRRELQKIAIVKQVGTYVFSGEIIGYLGHQSDKNGSEMAEQIAGIFHIDQLRTLNQDILFGIRQLTDIALKALSPSVNDPTTAQYCLSYLGDSLVQIAHKEPYAPKYIIWKDDILISHVEPDWDQYVHDSFSQIRRAATNDVFVLTGLIEVLYTISILVSEKDKHTALKKQAKIIHQELATTSMSVTDKSHLRTKLHQYFQL